MSYCVFDLETRYLFQDIDLKFKTYSWQKQNKLRKSILPKLGLAIAGIMFSDEEIIFFEEGNEKELIKELENNKKIIGHNIIDFDFQVLSFFDEEINEKLLPKAFDTFLELKKLTNCFCGLNELCKLNFGMQKTIDSIKIPRMWRTGNPVERKKVKEYLKNDLVMTKLLYEFGLNKGKLKFFRKEFGKIIGIEECAINWSEY